LQVCRIVHKEKAIILPPSCPSRRGS